MSIVYTEKLRFFYKIPDNYKWWSLQREMTQQGAALKSLEELKARRAALQQQIEAESLEKKKLESEKARWGWCCLDQSLQVYSWCRLEERLDLVNGSLEEKMSSLEGKMSSLEEKMLTGREHDKVIQEAE